MSWWEITSNNIQVEVYETLVEFPEVTAHISLHHFPDFDTFARVIDLPQVQAREVAGAPEEAQVNVWVKDAAQPGGRRHLDLGQVDSYLPASRTDTAKLYAYEQEASKRAFDTFVMDHMTAAPKR